MKNKINMLKALAIMLVVSGHLEFSLIPMFPPYSFQLALFFFISGMLFNEKYNFIEFFKRRFKSLLKPYIIYSIIYLLITIAITPLIGKFWGMDINWFNELVIPFLTGHQIDLTCPLWFVPQLFTTLIFYHICNKFKLHTIIYIILALAAIQLGEFKENLYVLYLLRTMYSLLFVHLGYIYKTRGQANLFTSKILYSIITIQAILWLTNADYTPEDGIGLSYILVWGDFSNKIVPILTSITGIWISLFIIEVSWNYIKDWDFLHKIGENTYHIMANHLFVFNIITYLLLWMKNIPFDVKNSASIYWFYAPLKTTYLYFLAGIVVPVIVAEFVKKVINKIRCKN